MIIEQQEFFEGLGFEECEFEYGTSKKKCFKGNDGGYYRIDHFRNSYVIEYAENEDDAKTNQFEDADLYDDSLHKNDLVRMIQSGLKKYVTK